MMKKRAVVLSAILVLVLLVYALQAWATANPQIPAWYANNVASGWVKAGVNATYIVTINNTGPNTLNSVNDYIRIKSTEAFVEAAVVSCTGNADFNSSVNTGVSPDSCDYYIISGQTWAVGESLNFTVVATTPSVPTDNNTITWNVATYDFDSTNNDTTFDVKIDVTSPSVVNASLQATDGTNTLSYTTLGAGTGTLNGGNVNVSVNISDASAGIGVATLYWGINSIPTTSSTNKSVMGNVGSVYSALIPDSNTSNGNVVSFIVGVNDTVGNLYLFNNSALLGYNFTVDESRPSVILLEIDDVFDLADDNITTSSRLHNISVNVSDSAISTVELTCNGTYFSMVNTTATSWNRSTTLANLGCSGDGTYNLTIRARDTVGNTNESVNISVVVDDTYPTVTSIWSNNTNTYYAVNSNAAKVTINATVGDRVYSQYRNVRVGYTTFVNMTNTTSTGSGIWTISTNYSVFGCSDGTVCTLTFNATDILGRTNDTVTTQVLYDSVAPALSSQTVSPTSRGGYIYRGTDTVTLNVTATNNIATVTATGPAGTVTLASIGSNVWQNSTATVSSLCNAGTCNISFNATDYAGNTNGTWLGFLITRDDTNPAVLTPGITELFLRGSQEWIRGTDGTNITVNATDNIAMYNVSVANGTPVLAMTESPSQIWSRVTNATYLGCSNANANSVTCIVTFTAYDNATNVNSTTTHTFYVDDRAPTIENGTPTTTVNNNQTSITFDIFDGGVGLNYSSVSINITDSAVSRVYTGPGNFTVSGNRFTFDVSAASISFANGDVAVNVTARDNLTNLASYRWVFGVATGAAVVTGLNVYPNPVANNSVLTITADANVSVASVTAAYYRITDSSNAVVQNWASMSAGDGAFDETYETVIGRWTASGTEGVYNVYVIAETNNSLNSSFAHLTFAINNSAGIDLLRSRVDTVNASVQTLSTRVDTLNTSIQNLQGNVSTLQTNVTVLRADVTVLQTNVTALYSLYNALNANDTTLLNNINTVNSSLTAQITRINTINSTLVAYMAFTITDQTNNTQQSTAFTLNVSTNVVANCTYEDIFGATTGNAMAGDNTVSHSASVNATITGYNLYRVTCADNTGYSFSKREDVLVRVLGMYDIDLPGNGLGFTTTFPDFFMSKNQLQATSLANYNLSRFLNATTGPTGERFTSANVNSMVWRWDSSASSWSSYNVSSEDFDMNTTTLSYYQVQLRSTALGKSIRHD